MNIRVLSVIALLLLSVVGCTMVNGYHIILTAAQLPDEKCFLIVLQQQFSEATIEIKKQTSAQTLYFLKFTDKSVPEWIKIGVSTKSTDKTISVGYGYVGSQLKGINKQETDRIKNALAPLIPKLEGFSRILQSTCNIDFDHEKTRKLCRGPFQDCNQLNP